MDVEIKLIPSASGRVVDIPEFATHGSACVDFRANIDTSISIPPGEDVLVPTGISMAVPDGYVLLLFPRSGKSVKEKMNLQNCVGVIDSDYRDEIFAPIRNTNVSKGYTWIEPGDRIVQGMIIKYEKPVFKVAQELNVTSRKGGFGHTGTK